MRRFEELKRRAVEIRAAGGQPVITLRGKQSVHLVNALTVLGYVVKIEGKLPGRKE